MIRDDCIRNAQSWRRILELSGVDKLLALSQELGVRTTREVERSRRTPSDRSAAVSRDRVGAPTREADFEVTISAAASRLAEDSALRAHPPQVDADVPRNRLPRTASAPDLLRGRAIAAYQRNARMVPGGHIRVRV
ncbi:MAG TPA: hypothetical protein ENI85_17145 [Deltaproteobacteria bacterium]|nr:hypothetical protein [Deltaproteobacteria bacterium]